MALNALTFATIDSSVDQELAEEESGTESSSSSVPQSRKKTVKKPKGKPGKKVKKSKKEKDRASSRRGNGKVMKYTTWRGTPDSCLHECFSIRRSNLESKVTFRVTELRNS